MGVFPIKIFPAPPFKWYYLIVQEAAGEKERHSESPNQVRPLLCFINECLANVHRMSLGRYIYQHHYHWCAVTVVHSFTLIHTYYRISMTGVYEARDGQQPPVLHLARATQLARPALGKDSCV